jgi:sodium-dependent phosphate transporter
MSFIIPNFCFLSDCLPVCLSVMCISAFAIGANDSANAWGTSVGSDAISLKKAVVLAALTDFLGAVTLGYGVSDTIQKGVSDVSDHQCWACGYCDSRMSVYSIGMFSASLSSAIFLMIASFAKMPVSATHAIVGAVVGMTIGGVGFECLDWSDTGLGGIVASWFLSPALAGILGAAFYILTKRHIMDSDEPRDRALLALPAFYAIATAVIIYVIMAKSAVTAAVPVVYQLLTTFLSLVIVALATWFFIIPFIKTQLPSQNPEEMDRGDTDKDTDQNGEETADGGELVSQSSQLSHHNSSGIPASASGVKMANILLSFSSSKGDILVPTATSGDIAMTEKASASAAPAASGPQPSGEGAGADSEELKQFHASSQFMKKNDALFCFKYLVVYIAALMSFAHGANDTANSTATFSAVYTVYQDGLTQCDSGTEIWILVVAGACSSLGTILLGYKVRFCFVRVLCALV